MPAIVAPLRGLVVHDDEPRADALGYNQTAPTVLQTGLESSGSMRSSADALRMGNRPFSWSLVL